MVNVGERIIKLRKDNNWSQNELAQKVGSSRIMVGKYERNESSPSVDVIVRFAKAFDVSVDFLLGESVNASYDKETIKRIEELEQLPQQEKNKVFEYIDLIVRDFKTKQAYQ